MQRRESHQAAAAVAGAAAGDVPVVETTTHQPPLGTTGRSPILEPVWSMSPMQGMLIGALDPLIGDSSGWSRVSAGRKGCRACANVRPLNRVLWLATDRNGTNC